MGIIQRQAFKQSTVSYVAAAIALLSTLYIYPLEKEAYGLAQWLINTAFFLVPFASLGITSLAVRFFPEFRDESNQNKGFLLKLILLSTLAYALFLLFAWILRKPFLDSLTTLGFDVSKIVQYKIPLILLIGLTLYNTLFTLYISNYKRIVVPAILRNLLLKIALPVLVFLMYSHVLTTPQYVWLWVATHGVVLIGMVQYAISLGAMDLKPQFSFLTGKLLRRMSSYAAYSGLSSIGSVITVRIDIIMLGLLLTMEDTGIYAIALFITNVIEIPTRAIWQIASPIIAKAWNDKDMGEISMIYTKSSINLLLPGVLMFLVVWLSVDDLFQITGKYDELVVGVMVVFYLGLAKLLDMATSVNSQIILYSDYYRYNLLFLLITALFNIFMNYHLISSMGIVGAAIATAASIALFNGMKYIFLLWKIGLQPFGKSTLKVLATGLLVWVLASFLPQIANPYFSVLAKSLFIAVLYIGIAFTWKISPDFENMIAGLYRKTKQYLNRS